MTFVGLPLRVGAVLAAGYVSKKTASLDRPKVSDRLRDRLLAMSDLAGDRDEELLADEGVGHVLALPGATTHDVERLWETFCELCSSGARPPARQRIAPMRVARQAELSAVEARRRS